MFLLIMLGILGLVILSATLDVFVFRDHYACIYFDWDAKAGFESISIAPPGVGAGPFLRVYSFVVAAQAGRFVESRLKNELGWSAAKGYFYVKLLPVPPVVFGLSDFVDPPAQIIDPDVSPLMLAAERDNIKLVRLLLASGADINARDQQGMTPLMHASMSGPVLPEMIEILVAAHGEVNAKDKKGSTPLIWASLYGGHSKVKALLAAHADPNLMNDEEETPLFEAVNKGDLELARLLLNANADPNIRARHRETVLSLAKVSRDAQMVELLEHAGARE